MNNIDLIESLANFKDTKSIDRPTLQRVLVDVFRTILKKRYGSDDNFDVIVNTDRGDLEIYHNRVIVENGEVEDPIVEIELNEARKEDPDYEVGEEHSIEIKIADFGRRAIQIAKQALQAKINEIEKASVYNKYKDLVGEVIYAEVYQIWKKEILLRHDGNEVILPRDQMIKGDRNSGRRGDHFKKGDTVKAIIQEVSDKGGAQTRILLSRTSSDFLGKLMEAEVPEIEDGLITIKNIVREPGERAKIAVETFDDRIDPVGACVGIKGSRIQGITRELCNENIDIINFTSNTQLYIQRALGSVEVMQADIDDINKVANIYLLSDDIAKAIGRNGSNIKLASKLTAYEVNIYREGQIDEEDDVDLMEFTDEIEEWIIRQLQEIGCDTARDVIKLSEADIIERADLEEETVSEIFKILKNELEIGAEDEEK